jgi:hypothetical protein
MGLRMIYSSPHMEKSRSIRLKWRSHPILRQLPFVSSALSCSALPHSPALLLASRGVGTVNAALSDHVWAMYVVP